MSERTGSTPLTRLDAWRQRRADTEYRRHQQRQRAFDLVPEIQAPQHHRRSIVVPLVSLLLSAALVGGLFLAFWQRNQNEVHLGAQADPVAADLPTDLHDTFAAAGGPVAAGHATAPSVLALHDVRPDGHGSDYVITPRKFAQILEMLKLSGYHSMTADEFIRYCRGEYQPPARSVLITFDDGTGGLYTYADPILKQYGFTGVSFLISGRITDRPGYYLSWAQVNRMQHSGRWDFESHTHDLHRKTRSADGTDTSQLTSRQLIDGRQETYAQLKRRISDDLDQSLNDFADHELPRPHLFAWPFSEVAQHPEDPRASAIALAQVKARFAYNFVNVRNPAPATRAGLMDPSIQRQEVLSKTPVKAVFTYLQNQQTLPMAAMSPTSVDDRWIRYGVPQAMNAKLMKAGVLKPVSARRYLPLAWTPQRTAGWTDYVASATLSTPGNAQEALMVHADSEGNGLRAVVSRNAVRVVAGKNTTLANRTFIRIGGHEGTTHRVVADVRGTRLRVTVDGLTIYSGAVPAGHGGPGVVFSREKAGDAWGTVRDLRVRPVAGS